MGVSFECNLVAGMGFFRYHSRQGAGRIIPRMVSPGSPGVGLG